jgi:hypothetical protein
VLQKKREKRERERERLREKDEVLRSSRRDLMDLMRDM